MSSTINALTTGGGGIAVGGDSSGQIALQSNGTTYATGNQYGIGLGTAVPSSGIGITFPATQSASTDANTLDDYEEGTWTPSDQSGASLSFTGASGFYVKIGSIVIAQFQLTFPSTANGSSVTIGNLPFSATTYSAGGNVNVTDYTTPVTIYFPSGGGVTFQPRTFGNTTPTNANFSGKLFRGTVIWTVN